MQRVSDRRLLRARVKMGPGNLRPRHRIARGFLSVVAKSDFGKQRHINLLAVLIVNHEPGEFKLFALLDFIGRTLTVDSGRHEKEEGVRLPMDWYPLDLRR